MAARMADRVPRRRLPRIGSYVTYNIMNESIVVVRVSEREIKAFFNVCQHRGRRLTEGCGRMNRFHCTFHGWQYHLDGSIARVLDRDDWAGCSNFSDADLHLKEVRVGTWAGWVFINMDLNAEPLSDILHRCRNTSIRTRWIRCGIAGTCRSRCRATGRWRGSL